MIWVDSSGSIVSCTEKLRVNDENLRELRDLMQEAFEDAILMGISSDQFKNYLHHLVDDLQNPYV